VFNTTKWKGRLAKGLRGPRGRDYPINTGDASIYPLDWREHASQPATPEDGVKAHGEGEDYFHPVATSFAGLAKHQSFVLEGADEQRAILGLARALCAHQRSGAWTYPVAVPEYGVRPGWVSGMAQGLAISFLLRASDLASADERRTFHDAARSAHEVLLRPIGQGGCCDWDPQGRPFFEECPAPMPPFILNGAVFALLGLHEFERRFGGSVSPLAAERLSELLPGWDLGYWSRYDLVGRVPSSPDYHSLHVSQLWVLDAYFDDAQFGHYAEKFDRYQRDRGQRTRAFVMLVAARSWQSLRIRGGA
jgi:hypothetical protein